MPACFCHCLRLCLGNLWDRDIRNARARFRPRPLFLALPPLARNRLLFSSAFCGLFRLLARLLHLTAPSSTITQTDVMPKCYAIGASPRSHEGTGEGGIRTLGTLLGYGALAKRCFRPLSHLTKKRLREYEVDRMIVKHPPL